MVKVSPELANDIRELSGIDPEPLFELGLLDPHHARKWVVKQQYFTLARSGRTYTDIKYELSERYGLSVSSIEKLVYRRQCEPVVLMKSEE
jgi:hypothetical protein